jgi:hypothetical protein
MRRSKGRPQFMRIPKIFIMAGILFSPEVAISAFEAGPVLRSSPQSYGESYGESNDELQGQLRGQVQGQHLLGWSKDARLGALFSHYAAPVAGHPLSTAFSPYFLLEGQGAYRTDAWSFGLNSGGVVYPDSVKESRFFLSELYWETSTKTNPRFQWTLGRRKADWSAMDRFWQAGLWEPQERWDNLTPKRSGLIGASASARFSFLQIKGFFSPFLIPESGPAFQLVDGKMLTRSPWVKAPAGRVSFQEKETPLRLELRDPAIEDVVFNPGAAVEIKIEKEDGFWVQASYAYKPLNQILLAYDGILDLLEDEVRLTIEPFIGYHHLATAEVGWKMGGVALWNSFTQEWPVLPESVNGLEAQKIDPSLSLGSFVGYEASRSQRLELGWLKRWGGNSGFWNLEDEIEVSTQTPRSYFSHALRLSGETSFEKVSLPRFSLVSSWTHEWSSGGDLLSADLRYQAGPQWSFGVGIDVLGASSKGGSDFISQYRANDRIRGGLNYVF